MYRESMNLIPDSVPSCDNEGTNHDRTRQQQNETNLWLPLQTLIDNGCNRIKKELESIQASNNSLLIEQNRLAIERTDLEKKLQVSDEKYRFIFLELFKQREVSDRLESIINRLIPFMPSEKHMEIVDSMYQAKQFTQEDLTRFKNHQLDSDQIISSDSIQPDRSKELKIVETNSAQTSLTNLLLQFLLLNATNKVTDGSPRMEEIVKNQVANVHPTNNLWPVNEPKSQVPKRKRTTKRKIQSTKQASDEPSEKLRLAISESPRVLPQVGVSEIRQSEVNQNKLQKIPGNTDIKPVLRTEGAENISFKRSSTPSPPPPQKYLKQKSMFDYVSTGKKSS